MNGKFVAVGILISAALVGAAIYYLQVYAYYSPIDAHSKTADIHLQRVGGDTPDILLVNDFEGIDSESSPLRYRSCFITPTTLEVMTDAYQQYDKPTPLIGPKWFTCFNAEKIGADLESGLAVAFLSEKDIHPGVDRVIAVYPDGRAYGWQQLNESADQ